VEVSSFTQRQRIGLDLDSVQHLLRLYVEALTGREVEIAPLAAVPDEARIDDGRTIHLPSLVNEFGDEDLDFRLYKVLAAHAAGQIEFGTYERGGMLRVAHAAIAEKYSEENVEAHDAFALADEIVQLRKDGHDETAKSTKEIGDVGYRDVLKLFPLPQLARRVFGTLENGRIDRRLRRTYRGLSRDLDLDPPASK
jgi:nitric oxide reductase NorD protein